MSAVVSPRFHSRISPSMMGRVEACTASHFLLPEKVAKDPTDYSTYGDVAHEIGEKLLRDPSILPFEILGDKYTSHGFEHEVDEDMLAIVQPYVDECMKFMGDGYLWNTEQQFWLDQKYTGKLPKVAGLVDFFASPEDPDAPVEIIDFKSGRQFVSEDALQLATYGLMVLDHFPGRQRRMRTTVVQPKADGPPVRSKDWEPEDVAKLEERLTRLFNEIQRGVFRFKFGDHCGFCPILVSCPKVRAVAKDAALAEVLASPEALARGDFTTEDFEEALAFLPLLDKWQKAVVNTAERYLEAGGTLDGAKLVRKRTQRRWRDGADPVPILEKHGIMPYTQKILSPAQAEKALPPAARTRIEGMIEKPVGGLTVAIGQDSRAAVSVRESLRRASEQSKALKFLAAGEKRADNAQNS